MNRRGITLFETLMAFIMVAAVATAAMESVSSELQAVGKARLAIEAGALAESRLDFVPLLTDAELLSLPDTVEAGTFDVPMDQYTWKMTSDPNQDQAGVYDIQIDILGPDTRFTVKSFAYRRPLVVTAQ